MLGRETRFPRCRSSRSATAGAASSSPVAPARSGTALTTLLLGFRPESVTVLDTHEAALTADRRRRGEAASGTSSATSATQAGSSSELAKARPGLLFHLAAYKHVDWAELYPEEFIDTNLQGSWNVLRAAERAGVETVVVASTDKGGARRQLLRADEALHGAAHRLRRPARGGGEA